MKLQELRKLIREEIMDSWPFNQADDYYEEEEEDTPTKTGEVVYSQDNYTMKKHPNTPNKFYVVDDRNLVKCMGSHEKCVRFMSKPSI